VPDTRRSRIIVEAIGIVAVVLSLVFVGFEIRQNTAATRSATQQAVYEGGVQSNVNVMNNERLRDLLVLTKNDPEWASTAPRDGDYLLVARFHLNHFNNLENAYYHYLQGTYDPKLWAGQEGWIRSIGVEPTMKHFWAEFHDSFFPEFQAYMDSTSWALAGEPATGTDHQVR